jgi:RNA polymerase sigma-70 factor (ECF subfamily)
MLAALSKHVALMPVRHLATRRLSGARLGTSLAIPLGAIQLGGQPVHWLRLWEPLMPIDVATQFEAHRGRVYRWAMMLCGRHDDALDVVQDVFLRMLRRPPTSESVPAVISWLRKTTHRAVIDIWRSARGRKETTAEPPPRLVSDAAPGSVEQLDRVRAAMARLSDQQRLVLLCKTCDEMTFQRIADELEISVSTAKTHYVRALQAVRERLGTHVLEEAR